MMAGLQQMPSNAKEVLHESMHGQTSVPTCSSKSRNSVVNFLSRSQDEESLAAQKAVEWVGEIPTDLHHETGHLARELVPAMCTFREDSSMTTST